MFVISIGMSEVSITRSKGTLIARTHHFLTIIGEERLMPEACIPTRRTQASHAAVKTLAPGTQFTFAGINEVRRAIVAEHSLTRSAPMISTTRDRTTRLTHFILTSSLTSSS